MRRFLRTLRTIRSKKGILRASMFLAGYILSPLTWWNDLFVNIPLSYVIASLLTHVLGRELFPQLFATAYLFTNILGLLLMHISISWGITRRKILIDVAAAALYTILVYALAYYGIIQPF